MKLISRLIYLVFILYFVFPFKGSCQIEKQENQKSKTLSVAREIIKSAGPCSLISIDKEGRPRARAMDAFPIEDNFTVWFGTNPKSRKVAQIKNDSRVTIYFLAENASGYVTIYGRAQLINDKLSKKKYWKPKWKNFYPDYPNDYLLIKVTPEWLEVISEAHGISGDSVTWQPPAVRLTKKE